jgi:hydrogenase expression/formation protein HypE
MKHDRISLGHGGGGILSSDLLQNVVFPFFQDVQATDGAVLNAPKDKRLVFTTDSFVVKPLFFPGGNIGSIAVNGTVNDLAMMGAEPAYLSLGLILEEGLEIPKLQAILESISQAAKAANICIVTGDTKVVGRGEADGIYINTAGIGFVDKTYVFHPSRVKPGDAVIVNGGIAQHGTAVMAERLGVSFNPPLMSDSHPLRASVSALFDAGIVPRVMRDVTRGGLASVMAELAQGQTVDYLLHETAIPIDPRIKRACDIWGFDPLYVASEGRFIAVVDGREAEQAIQALKQTEPMFDAQIIGEVVEGNGQVVMKTAVGGKRPIQPLPSELLPRIC